MPKHHKTRRNELLDLAQGLFIQNGYDATPVSAILEAAGVAKGTFYHHFKSKEDLLDALVERMTDLILDRMRDAVFVEGLGAVEQMKEYFRASSQWKAQNREALMALVKPLYSDRNLLLRHKMNARTLERALPDLEAIIEQGVREKVFDTSDPREAAEMVLGVSFAMREMNANFFLNIENHPEQWDVLVGKLKFFENAIERLLGAPEGSLDWFDEKSLELFRPPEAK